MSSEQKDGGPAFPVPHSIDGNWVKEPLVGFRALATKPPHDR